MPAQSGRPVTHTVKGFMEVLLPEDALEYAEEHPAALGALLLKLIDENAGVVVIAPFYEDDDGEEV